MNFQIAVERLRTFLKIIAAGGKEAIKLPYAKFYILLAVPLTIVFLLFTFPYDLVIREQIKKLEGRVARNIFIGDMQINMLRDSYIEKIQMVFDGGAELNLMDIDCDVALNPVTTLFNKTAKGDVAVRNLTYNNGESILKAALSAIFAIKINPQTGLPSDGPIALKMRNISLKGITIKGFVIPPLQIPEADGNGVIKNSELTITGIRLTGPDVRGTISGTVMISRYAGGAPINLVIELDPGSAIFEEYRVLLGSIAKQNGGPVRITVTGTLQNPAVSFPNTAGNMH